MSADGDEQEESPPEGGDAPPSEKEPSPAGEEEGNAQRKSPWGNKIRRNQGQAVNAARIDGGVHYHEHIGEGATHRLRHAARVSEERLKEIRDTFCPRDAGKYALFQKELRSRGTGVITGKPGTGRAFTAVHAMITCRPANPVEELSVDPTERDAGVSLINIDSAHSRFLDLTPLGVPTPIQRIALRSLADDAHRAGALLVLIASPGQREEYLTEHPVCLHIDAPARAVDVFQRAMGKRYKAEIVDHWLRDPGVRDALEGAEPARAIRLAQEAFRLRSSYEDEADWIKNVLEDYDDTTEELARWFTRHDLEKEFRRVLLATVALLEGGDRTVVVSQARRLAQEWYIPSMWRTPISGEGLTAHLWEIGAHVREDRVHFNRRTFGDEVLDYLWREHPETRVSVQEWAAEAVTELDAPPRAEAARRWLRLARRHRDTTPVRTLIDRWGNSSSLMWAAIPVIAEAAVAPEFGPQVRELLYRTARSWGVSLRDRTVLEVCRVYGRVQPATALTRVRLIAEKVPAYWDETVLQALEDISGEPENTAVVLGTLVDWTQRKERGRRANVARLALCRLLGATDGPVPRVLAALDRGEVASDDLVRAWHAASYAGSEAGRALWAWFDALADTLGRPGGAFEVLREVAHGHDRIRLELVRWARRWKHAHTRRAPALEELLRTLGEGEETR